MFYDGALQVVTVFVFVHNPRLKLPQSDLVNSLRVLPNQTEAAVSSNCHLRTNLKFLTIKPLVDQHHKTLLIVIGLRGI